MRPCNIRPGKTIFHVHAIVHSNGEISANLQKYTVVSVAGGVMRLKDQGGYDSNLHLGDSNIPSKHYNLTRAFFHPKAAQRYTDRLNKVDLRGEELDIHAEISMERSFSEAQEDYDARCHYDDAA